MSVGAHVLKMTDRNKTRCRIEQARRGNGGFTKSELRELRSKAMALYGKDDELVLNLAEIDKLAVKKKHHIMPELEELVDDLENEIIDADGDEEIIVGEMKKFKKKIEEIISKRESEEKSSFSTSLETLWDDLGLSGKSIAEWSASYVKETMGDKSTWEEQIDDFLNKKEIQIPVKEKKEAKESLLKVGDILYEFAETRQMPSMNDLFFIARMSVFICKVSYAAVTTMEEKSSAPTTAPKKNQNQK